MLRSARSGSWGTGSAASSTSAGCSFVITKDSLRNDRASRRAGRTGARSAGSASIANCCRTGHADDTVCEAAVVDGDLSARGRGRRSAAAVVIVVQLGLQAIRIEELVVLANRPGVVRVGDELRTTGDGESDRGASAW